MNIIGISCYYHDSAVALIRDGELVNAIQEERISRVKHDQRFPVNALSYILDEHEKSGNSPVDAFVFYEKPLLKFDRIIENYIGFAPKGFVNFRDSLPLWTRKKMFQRHSLRKQITELLSDKGIGSLDLNQNIYFSDHHLSHAASAFFPSPYEEACVVTVDGVGEWSTASIGFGRGNDLKIIKTQNYPHSLGFLYSTLTAFCGFKVNSGEYKFMGLAPYGEPRFYESMRQNLIKLKEDGSFFLNLDFFSFATGNTMYSRKIGKLFDIGPRLPESEIEQVHCDIAASTQKLLEEIFLGIATYASKVSPSKNLCLAGGVALNCVANSVIKRANIFENVWIQPAAGDAGGAIGAAFAFHYLAKEGLDHKPKRVLKKIDNAYVDSMKNAYLGREFLDHEIQEALDKSALTYEKFNTFDELNKSVAKQLSDGKSVGWFQGKSEFGPRSLGNRSILADPRSPSIQSLLNLQVKFRESFRPFAPAVLEENVNDWFEWDTKSPYMLFVADVKEEHRLKEEVKYSSSKSEFTKDLILEINKVRSVVPAITHVDYSARIQTVSLEGNPIFYALIKEFRNITGVPILVNTSFNVRGEPIVDSPLDAVRCFLGTQIDILVIGTYVVKKSQNMHLMLDYRNLYELD